MALVSADHDRPIGPWPRTVRPGSIHKTSREAVLASVLFEDDDALVLNKDGELPCHPSKDGPWSCLSGAVRETFGAAAAHLVFRLDRETSGAVVFAKHPKAARRLQGAVHAGRYRKTYLAILTGTLTGVTKVDQPLGADRDSVVAVKNCVVPEGGQRAVTTFSPLYSKNGFTLTRVITETGRKHQIRAHAQWLGHWLVGDKIYGPDARLFLDFVEHGWGPGLEAVLHLRRQGLHCESVELRRAGLPYVFHAPLAADLQRFLRERMEWPGFDEKTRWAPADEHFHWDPVPE